MINRQLELAYQHLDGKEEQLYNDALTDLQIQVKEKYTYEDIITLYEKAASEL